MEYANAGRLFREVAGAAKDAFVVHIEPHVGDFADKGKEIVLFPYKKMIVPVFQYIKSKLGGRKGDLVVNGKSINFIVPEKYTKLGLGREFNNILRDHEDTVKFYENWPNRKLYIDTDMNIYELTNGDNSMVKIFGDGRFYDSSELQEIPVGKIMGQGVRSVEDYLDRQRELVNTDKDNFVPLSNIFPSSNQQEARDQLNDYLFEANTHSKLDEDTKKIHKVESLDANSYSNLLERLKQERNFEKETNMLERLETDDVFLRVLSNKELAKKAEEIYKIYMKKGTLSMSNWINTLRKKDNVTYYNSLNPFKNNYLEAMNDNIKSVEALAPSIKGLIGNRAKNLAIDAGIGALASTVDKWLPPLVGVTAVLVQFLLNCAFKIKNVDRRNEYTDKLENLVETSIKLNEAAQLQFSGNLIAQQNSNNLMLMIVDSIKQVQNVMNNMNSEKNTKRLEYATKKIFDKNIKENPDDQFIFKDQEIPFSESLRKIEFPENNQKKLNMPKKRKTGEEYSELYDKLYDKYVIKREDPFPLKAWFGRLKANKQYGPKYAAIKKIIDNFIGWAPAPPAPEIPFPRKMYRPPPAPPAPSYNDMYNDINRDRPDWDISDIGIIEDAIPSLPEPPLAITKINPARVSGTFENRILSQGGVNEEEANMIGANIRKMIAKDTRFNYNGPKHLEGEAVVERLQRLQYEPDEPEPSMENPPAYDPFKWEDISEGPSKRAKVNWPKEFLKATANHVWGKRMFLFLIFSERA